ALNATPAPAATTPVKPFSPQSEQIKNAVMGVFGGLNECVKASGGGENGLIDLMHGMMNPGGTTSNPLVNAAQLARHTPGVMEKIDSEIQEQSGYNLAELVQRSMKLGKIEDKSRQRKRLNKKKKAVADP
ncbi:MAG: hypothetical protein K0U52_13605, partial [Gammaproteobacteria bacterium]|nr:hypothetical protein [Gammaproteobacteria bacterium]